MTAVSYSLHLTKLLTDRLGAEKGKQVEDIVSEVVLKNLLSQGYDFSFPIVDQSKFGIDNNHRYQNVSQYRSMIRGIYPRIGLFISAFFSSSQPLVELGAGLPDSDGQTLLTKVLPKKFNITFTDKNPLIVSEGRKIVSSYRLKDASDLKDSQERQFAACNLIDTFTDDALKSFLDNLPPGSTFVHFNDMTPFINRFAWDLSKKYDIFFPYFEGNEFIGAIIVKDYQAIRASLKDRLDEMEVNFLDQVKSYNSEQKERTFNLMLKANNDAISLWIKKIIPSENLRLVPIGDYFETRLRNIEHSQITKLFCGAVKFSEIVDKDATLSRPLINRIHFNGRYASYSKIYVLAPGKELIEAYITIYAIQKTC